MNFADNEKTFFDDEQGFQNFLGIGSKKKIKKAQAEADAAKLKAAETEAALSKLLPRTAASTTSSFGVEQSPTLYPKSTTTATETVISATTVKGDGTTDVAGAGLPVKNNTKKYLIWGGVGLVAVVTIALILRNKK